MTPEAKALKLYNSLFDNQQYRAIGDHLTADINVQRDAQIVSDALNMVTNAALGLCGHPSYTDSWLKLAAFCGTNTVTPQTIDLIHAYLLMFQQAYDNRTDDFMLTAKALLKTNAALDLLKEGVPCANGIHGWRGRMAYHSWLRQITCSTPPMLCFTPIQTATSPRSFAQVYHISIRHNMNIYRPNLCFTSPCFTHILFHPACFTRHCFTPPECALYAHRLIQQQSPHAEADHTLSPVPV